MEPTSLNSLPPDDDQLEAWLRANAALPTLADDGFSTRVAATLPRPALHQPDRVRLLFCVAGAAAGTAVAFFKVIRAIDLPWNLGDVEHEFNRTASQLSNPATAIALLITAASLLFVFRRDLRTRSRSRI